MELGSQLGGTDLMIESEKYSNQPIQRSHIIVLFYN